MRELVARFETVADQLAPRHRSVLACVWGLVAGDRGARLRGAAGRLSVSVLSS